MSSDLQYVSGLAEAFDTLLIDTGVVLRLIGVLVQGDTDLYQQTYKLLTRIALKEAHLLATPEVTSALAQAISRDSIAQIRVLELVVDLSNVNRELFGAYEATGLLRQALEVYFTDDILAKLASIQIIEKFGDSPDSCAYLMQSTFISQLQREFEEGSGDDSSRLSLMVLFAKLHTWSHSYEFSQPFWDLLISALSERTYTHYNYGFTAFCQIASSTEVKSRQGAHILFSNNNLVTAWLTHQKSGQAESKTAFYISLAVVLRHADEVVARQAFNCVQLGLLQKDFRQVFSDVKSAALEAIEVAAKFPWAAEKLYSDPSFAESILTRSPHNSAELCRRLHSANKAALESGAQFDSVLLGHLRQFVSAGVFAVVDSFQVMEEAN
jgi:hypothetical protein